MAGMSDETIAVLKELRRDLLGTYPNPDEADADDRGALYDYFVALIDSRLPKPTPEERAREARRPAVTDLTPEHDDLPPLTSRTADAYRRQYPTRQQIVAEVLIEHWEVTDYGFETIGCDCGFRGRGAALTDHFAAEVVKALDAAGEWEYGTFNTGETTIHVRRRKAGPWEPIPEEEYDT